MLLSKETPYILLYKVNYDRKPKYFVEKLSSNQNSFYKTRFQDDGRIKNPRIYRRDESKTSFVPDSIAVWNRLPAFIRKSKNPEVFKTNLKPWIANNIEI